MSGPLERLRNIGPASAQMLRDCGIETPDEVQRLGAAMAYRIVSHRFPRVSVLLLYALHGAVDGRHWNDYSEEEKVRIHDETDAPLTVG